MSARLAIVAALEALEVGDDHLAVAILTGALEDGPADPRYSCDLCTMAFEQPGLLGHHKQLGHGVDPA